MKLLTDKIRRALPPLGSQEHNPDPIVHVKFFSPDTGWTWYATEGGDDGGRFLFFGYVVGFEPEWGYFALSELSEIRGQLGLPVERDLYFKPCPSSVITEKYKNWGRE
jgi:hypothetical protein